MPAARSTAKGPCSCHGECFMARCSLDAAALADSSESLARQHGLGHSATLERNWSPSVWPVLPRGMWGSGATTAMESPPGSKGLLLPAQDQIVLSN